MRGLIAALLLAWGVAFGLAEPTPPSGATGTAASASAQTQPTSNDANEAPVLAPQGEQFDNLAAIVAGLSRRSPVLSIAISPDGRSLASGYFGQHDPSVGPGQRQGAAPPRRTYWPCIFRRLCARRPQPRVRL